MNLKYILWEVLKDGAKSFFGRYTRTYILLRNAFYGRHAIRGNPRSVRSIEQQEEQLFVKSGWQHVVDSEVEREIRNGKLYEKKIRLFEISCLSSIESLIKPCVYKNFLGLKRACL